MIARGHIRKVEGAKVQVSEIVRRSQLGALRSVTRNQRATLVGRATRSGWSTFETAPKVDEFGASTPTKKPRDAITLPRRTGKPGGASIHVPEGNWHVEEQLRGERGREL